MTIRTQEQVKIRKTLKLAEIYLLYAKIALLLFAAAAIHLGMENSRYAHPRPKMEN
jgi:hypothetical protein